MEYKNCPTAKYHWFIVLSGPYSREYSETQVEVCKFCKVRKAYAFRPDGKMVDDHQYFLDHIRAFAQPSMGEVYYECNPGMLMKFQNEARAEKKKEERDADLSDKFKFALKRAYEDRDDGIKKR